MKLEEIKKGQLGKSPIEMAFASVRLPKETYDYIRTNNISLRKLIVAAVEELKKEGDVRYVNIRTHFTTSEVN